VLHARIPGFRQRIIPELWDNPFQGGIWLAVEMECVVQS
jgi:hypothetical protein